MADRLTVMLSDQHPDRVKGSNMLVQARVLAEIVRIQREYVRAGEARRMWELLLESIQKATASDYGFIGEVEWSDSGMPRLETRAMTWTGDATSMRVHPDIGLLVSQVIAEGAPVTVAAGDSTASTAGLFSPITGFLGIPLTSADRLVGVVGVTGPSSVYDAELIEILEPLLSSCGSIIESIQSTASRDRAMRELENTNSFLQAIFDATIQGVVVVDARGTIEVANSAAAAILGVDVPRLVGQSVGSFVARDRADRVEELVASAIDLGLGSQAKRLFIHLVRPDGRSVPADVVVSSMMVQGTRRLVLLVDDVTEQVRTRKSLARAGAIVEATPDLVAWTDAGGALRHLNTGGRRMIGVAPDDPIDHLVLADLLSVPTARLVMGEGVDAAVAFGSWAGEGSISAVGGDMPASLVVLAGEDTDGHYLVLMGRDLTDRLEVEAMKDAFVSNVSHELRTPLASMLGYLEMLIDGSFGEFDETQVEMLHVVERNGERLLQLIAQLLEISDESTTDSETFEAVDVAEVVRRIVEQIDVQAVGAGIDLVLETLPEAEVSGSAKDLETVFQNLVGNALKFSERGGRIAIRADVEDVFLRVVVADRGIGIPLHDQEKVFNRFHRGENARSREIQGTGLGLSLVDGIVKRHGGQIVLESELGAGTTVTVLLPVQKEDDR